MKKKIVALVSMDALEDLIFFIRGHRVMFDSDLADLYEVPTKAFNQAIKRNLNRFPADFMFRLSSPEANTMRSQIVTASKRNLRYLPYVFTQEGVAMLSGVLHSARAIDVNVAIMRAFVRMREVLSTNRDLAGKLDQLENKLIAHDYQIEEILRAIRKLMHGPKKHLSKIGYKP